MTIPKGSGTDCTSQATLIHVVQSVRRTQVSSEAPLPGPMPSNQISGADLLSLYDEGVKANQFNVLEPSTYHFRVVSAKVDQSKGSIRFQYEVASGPLVGTKFYAGNINSRGEDAEKVRSIFAQNIASLGFSREDIARLGTLQALADATIGREYQAEITNREHNGKTYNQIAIGGYKLVGAAPATGALPAATVPHATLRQVESVLAATAPAALPPAAIATTPVADDEATQFAAWKAAQPAATAPAGAPSTPVGPPVVQPVTPVAAVTPGVVIADNPSF
jgi:Protein of unknown function (DUF669)